MLVPSVISGDSVVINLNLKTKMNIIVRKRRF